MKNNEITISDIPELKTISPSSSPRDQAINTTSEGRASSFSDSSSSSPSDLRRRLEDLPSPDEFTLLADRVAALSRRICRKRELFLLHGVANRIEESDEWEEEEQRAGSEISLAAFRLKDPRARRRARVRLESSSCCDAKAMLISQADGTTDPSKITDDDDKSNPAESSVDRSARDNDCLRFPAIEIPRRQPRPSSLSEPSSSRISYHNNGESRDIRCKTAFHSHRNFTPRDSAPKSVDLPSVSLFSFSSVRSKKFGGYRPSSGVVLKNLSSGSESESANEASRGFSFAQKNGNSIATLELSSPESKSAVVNGLIKKMPIMSARSDITGSVLPNLLPSTRSLGDSDLDHRISQATWRSCIVGQANRDGFEWEEGEQRAGFESSLAASRSKDARARRRARIHLESSPHRDAKAMLISETDDFIGTSKITDDDDRSMEKVEPEYEDTCDEKEEMPQNMLTFSARHFVSQSVEHVTSNCNEHVIYDEAVINAYKQEFKQVGPEFENTYNEKEEMESYRCITPKIHHDDIKDQSDFNYPIDQSNLEVNSLENINKDILDTAEWNQLTSLYTKEAADVPYLIERIQTDVVEEVLSSQASEPFESEDHSPSSHTPKIYLQREMLSSRILQNDIDTSDKCDHEITTNVPALALNSQDISYSTSAGSQERFATQPLDPHALIKALSDVSLKQERQAENESRKYEDFYRQGKNIDVLSRASDFPTKGETWRAPRFSTIKSPRKSLSRVSSRIPIRTSSSNIISSTSANKLSGYSKHSENSNKIANCEETKFIDQNIVQHENIVRQQPDVNSSYSQIHKRDCLLRSRNENIEVTIVKAHSGTFAPDDEVAEYGANDYELGSLTSSNLQSPQSTPFGDHTYNKMKHLPESRFSEKSCPAALFNKAAYSNDRDYTKIDDDVWSRSDHSTSRRSADTMNVTSATESPSLSRYKKNESFHIESLRNVEENVTWRTEDECPSIKDEEDFEYMKDNNYYGSYNKKSEQPYLETKEHLKLAIEKTYNTFRNQHLQLDPSLKVEKDAKKQQVSDDLEFNDDESSFDQSLGLTKVAQLQNSTYEVRRTQELSSFTATISSPMPNLNCEPKKKKKSQERFPFTISEASEVLSTEYKDTGDYQLPDESVDRTKIDDQLEDKTVYQLKMHPSITRLATSGLEDTVTDILCCVAQEKKYEKSSKSRMKAFMRIFSSKLRKSSKQPNDDKTLEPAKIIYENRICQIDSKGNSCSGDSSIEEAHRINFDKSSDKHWIEHHVARSNPMLVSSGNTPKKTESAQAIVQKYPHRRFDRDDLWVQDIKNRSELDPSFDEKKNIKSLQREEEADNSKESPSKDRYSIFLAKNLQSDKPSESNIDHVNSPRGQHDVLTSGHVMPSDGKSKQSIDQNIPSDFIPEVEEIEEDLTGCLCWRLCRIFAPSKYRLSIREPVSSPRTKKSSFLLQKRKK